MKIYPSRASIVATKEVNQITDIPLSYIDTQQMDYSINTIIDNLFQSKSRSEILPYTQLDNLNFSLFDANDNQVSITELNTNFHRQGDKYVYIPDGSSSFTPRKFTYKIIGKKKMNYSSYLQYNLNVFLYSKSIAENLMPIFGDAPLRNVAPSNITVNNMDLSTNPLFNGRFNEKDMCFVQMSNEKYDMENNEIDRSIPINNQSNLWVMYNEVYGRVEGAEVDPGDVSALIPSQAESYGLEDYEITTALNGENTDLNDLYDQLVNGQQKEQLPVHRMYVDTEEKTYTVKSPLIYKEVQMKSKFYFNVPQDTDKIKYHNIFSSSNRVPLLIEEHVGKGFIIYSPDILLYPTALTYSPFIYEVMMYIYLKSYVSKDNLEEWITDTIPDYIVDNNVLFKKDKFTSSTEINKMFGLKANDVSLCDVYIYPEYPYVKFTGVSRNYITFTKDTEGANSIYADPPKPQGAISIYTERQNIMYITKFLYAINDSLEDKMQIEKFDNEYKITIKPFKHSTCGINVKTMSYLSIKLSDMVNNNEVQIQNADYYIISKSNDSASFFECIDSKDYSPSKGIIIATLQIRQDESKRVMYDMRQRGGGLPEGQPDNFNCFDIGHINGRPYRKSGTLIITLPKYLEKHKDLVMETVKQYSVAEDYPIIIFKEDEE